MVAGRLGRSGGPGTLTTLDARKIPPPLVPRFHESEVGLNVFSSPSDSAGPSRGSAQRLDFCACRAARRPFRCDWGFADLAKPRVWIHVQRVREWGAGLANDRRFGMENRRVLVAEDDPAQALVLRVSLARWGYEPTMCTDGEQAWRALQEPDPPTVAILDWMMPGMAGVEICQRVRAMPELTGMYIILLTTRSSKQDVVEGLWAGADDYVVKPFHVQEMRARVRVGTRVATLQKALADRVAELDRAAASIKRLQGLLPMCAYCKSIRNDQNYWERVEKYISEHSAAQFTHGICPECYDKVMRTVGINGGEKG